MRHLDTATPPPTIADGAGAETVDEAAERSAGARLFLGIASLTALLIGVLGLLLQLDPMRSLGLGGYLVWGVGSAAWQTNPWLRLPGRLALSGTLGLVVTVVVSSVMVLTGAWFPMTAFLVATAVTVPLHAIGIRRAWPDTSFATPRPQGRHGSTGAFHRPSAQVLLAASGAALCLVVALLERGSAAQFGGLLSFGPLWLAGVALILAALALSRYTGERRLAVTVTLLTLVLTLTPALVYGLPRSQSAAKHLDLVQQISQFHGLDSVVAVYNAWPGFFGAGAWISDVAGLIDPMGLATFWPVLLGVLRLVCLRYFFGKVLRNPFQAWIATALAVLADPQGADYFSPQSIGFVFGIAVFGLALAARPTRVRLIMMGAAGVSLAISHQLSPYIVGGVLVVLVVFRQLRPWWSPALVLGPALLWTVIHLDAVRGFLSFGSVGDAGNFLPPPTEATPGLARLPIVGYSVAALAASVLIMAALAAVALYRHRREPLFWAMACASGVGLVLVFLNPYGREGIFRAVLFATPWLALMAAHLFRPSGRMRGRIPLFGLVTALAVFFSIAGFGMDRINVMRPGDVAALAAFESAGTGQVGQRQYLLDLGKGNLPNSPPRVADTHDLVTRGKLGVPVGQEAGEDPALTVDELTDRFVAYTTAQTRRTVDLYALWSPTSSDHMQAYGIEDPDDFARLRDAFAASPDWTVVLAQDGTTLFHFVGPAAASR